MKSELTLIPVIVLEDGHWDRLNDCKVAFVTPAQLHAMCADEDKAEPLETSRIVVDAGEVLG